MPPAVGPRSCESIHHRSLQCVLVTIVVVLGAAVPQAMGADLALPSTGVADAWLTTAERTGFEQTPRYDETVAYCRRLAEASEWVEYTTFGTSPQGRALPLLVVSKNGAFTPQAAHETGKLIVLIQNGIHAGECEGKDASLMLVRDIVVTMSRQALLDHVILVVMPIFNVDGHERFSAYSRINQNGPTEMGWRVTAQRLNLNRDYLKADAPEMRAWIGVWNEWRPDLHFDNHTTDGGDWRYDITFDADTHATADPGMAGWLKDSLYPRVFSGLNADGHVPMIYFETNDSKDVAKGISSGGFSPRFSTGYGSIRNRPSILVETHMLKDYRTRVFATYQIMRHTLELLNEDPAVLRRIVREADAETTRRGGSYDPDAKFPLSVRTTDETTPITFLGFAYHRELSELSGDLRVFYDNTKPIDIETTWRKTTEPDKTVAPPLAYIIPPEWSEAIEVAKLHGLRVRRLTAPAAIEVESYRFVETSFSGRSFEGRQAVIFKTELVTERREYPPGSVIVRLDQPDAKVAIHLFEPDAPDSLVRWGFFNNVFEQKEYGEHYVLEALARKMLAADPALRNTFEEKIRSDRDFAGSARARLNFFYERSPYWDKALRVYPVGRITKTLDVPTEE